MKRIAIFCDGTWNGLDTGRPSNVKQLARAVMPVATDGVVQLVYYQPGPGSGRGRFAATRALDKWAGGAFGWGLDANLRDVYRQLMFWYEPGDEVYIFGFSRGAYMARSLVGLIRMAGIASPDHEDGLEQAIDWYRRRDPRGVLDSPGNLIFRQALSPVTATSLVDLVWRQRERDTDAILFRVRYLGVWDTVGALGLPRVLGTPAQLFNRRFAFHDHDLSHMVWSARHAVAIDERRKLYPPTLWRNIERLNAGAGKRDRPYRQAWFPGNHGVIGGTGTVPELSACAAQWVIDGARKVDLHFERGLLDRLRQTARPDVPVTGGFDPPEGALDSWLLADRTGLTRLEDVSATARQRFGACPDYRPGALKPVQAALEAEAARQS